MRLKRLELAGFKSFVDPTKIEFGKGITAIVGPNGCGKSNIVDALRWVLGEHSAKHLRGGVMDDLIFQGSDTRPPVAVCDVELTFAVERGALPSPYHELDEISIRRRLTREGGSDAFINGKMVRIKDIIDLFLDTGISTRAYAIIEQDSIARMVTAKPEERRIIFEEAAGVMKYRSRRRETERRMKDTRQNLERVADLLEEVRSQCRSLKQQASRAARFKELQDEFSRLRSISLGLRYQELQNKFEETLKFLDEAVTGETKAGRELTNAEKSVAVLREQWLAHEQDAQRVQDRLREAERRRADLQQQAERLAGERRLLAERKATLQGRIKDTEERQQQLASEITACEAQLASQSDDQLKANRQTAATAVEQAQLQYRQQGQQRDALMAEYERLRQSSEQAAQQRQKSEAALNRLGEREVQLRERLQQVELQSEQTASAAGQAANALSLADVARQQAEAALSSALTELERCRSERQSAAAALSEHEAQVRELAGVVQQLRGQTKNQDIPEALRDELRGRGAVWMDESLEVPEGLEAAVAAALRGRSADARIPANPNLHAWRDTLAASTSAPVALFAKPGVKRATPGYSLAEAIKLQPDHPLYDVFAPVELLDDITDAAGNGSDCVSRDGWRYEPSGWLIPPAGNRTANRLSLQRQLREQEKRATAAEARLADIRQRFSAAESALAGQQESWQQAHLAATQAESDWHATQSAASRLEAEGRALAERRQALESDIREVGEERQHWQMQLAQAADADQNSIDEAKEQLDHQNSCLQVSEQTLDTARRQLAQAEQALALFAQARESIKRELGRLQQEQRRFAEQQAADSQRLQQVELEWRQASEQTSLDKTLSQAAEEVDAAHQAMNLIRRQGHDAQQALHEAERTERRVRQSLQQASERRQGIELQQMQQQTRLQDIETEIEQRCHTSAGALINKLENMEAIEDAAAILQRTLELEERLERFGPVNLLAIEEFEQASEREGFLTDQVADLQASLDTLTETIARIDRTTKQRFQEVFEQTNAIFEKTFPQLFGGGRAQLRLDSDDVLTAGVEVIAQPPGKRLQDVTLLSGGEKALTAVALVFSIFKLKPAPFCVLDEVDAPLDDANVGRYGAMVRELADQVQFFAITHNKMTMQQADRLIGVSMPEPGASRIVAVDLQSIPH